MIDSLDLFLDTVQGQLLAQAAWYDLRDMEQRRAVTARITRQFLMMQKVLGTTCFLEIGAHEASFARSARKEYPDAKIYAFEANPHVYQRYYGEFSASPCSHVDYRHLAVGDKDGMTDFLLAAQIDGQDEPRESTRNSLLSRTGTGHTYDAVAVPTTRLDSFIAKEGLGQEQLCLWIDAEGATRQILEGAVDTLPKVTSILAEVELEPIWQGQWTAKEVMGWCYEMGFLPILRDFARKKQFNCIFIQKKYYSEIELNISQYIQRCIRHRIEGLIGQ